MNPAWPEKRGGERTRRRPRTLGERVDVLGLVRTCGSNCGGELVEGVAARPAVMKTRRQSGEKVAEGRRRLRTGVASPASPATKTRSRGVERLDSTLTRRVSAGFLGPYPVKTGPPNKPRVFYWARNLHPKTGLNSP
jgi:hypothetical protein